MSKGIILEPSKLIGYPGSKVATEPVHRQEIVSDLNSLWQLVLGEVGGDLIWASDPNLNCTIPIGEYEKSEGAIRQSYRYISPGHLAYPKDFPVPGLGIKLDTFHPWNNSGMGFGFSSFYDNVPLLVFANPIPIEKSNLLGFKIENISTDKGVVEADEGKLSLDQVLQDMKVPEAFVVEFAAFLPIAGEGQTYKTEFVPAAWCPNSDYRFATIKARTLIGNNWAVEKNHTQNLEDLSDSSDPKLYEAVYHVFSANKPSPDNNLNQMIVIAQPGMISKITAPKRMIRVPPRTYGGGGGGYDNERSMKMGFVFDTPEIETGSSTGTQTSTVKFEESSHPAVVYHLNVIGVTKAQMPNVNPQGFEEFMRRSVYR